MKKQTTKEAAKAPATTLAAQIEAANQTKGTTMTTDAKVAAAKARAADKRAKAALKAEAPTPEVQIDINAAAEAKREAAALKKQEKEARAAARAEVLAKAKADKEAAAKARATEREAARLERLANPVARTVPAQLDRYTKDKTHKTAGGNVSVHCGDPIAERLLGKSLEQVFDDAAGVLGVGKEALMAQYAHLNVGMQRMNLGNRMRGVLFPKAAPKTPKAPKVAPNAAAMETLSTMIG